MNSDQNIPLENKFFELEINGKKERIPAIDKRWVNLKKRSFSRYIAHPIPVDGNFSVGEKEIWLELANYVIEDLQWLLQQKHHIFWSHMIFSQEAQLLLVSFLQEAPPYYLRSEFPKDHQMEEAMQQVEHLVFLVFVRLSTERESDSNFIQDLGQLLYENYIFTVPILLDICLIYGVTNKDHVMKMFENVVSACPMYLNDLKGIVPHFTHVLSVVKDKFEENLYLIVDDEKPVEWNEIRDVLLHLYDTVTNIHIFLDIYSIGSKLFRTDSLIADVTYFYNTVVPKLYRVLKKVNCDQEHIIKWRKKIYELRINLLSIVRNVLCGIVNDVLSDSDNKQEYANEYYTKSMDIVQEPLFLSDYNSIYPMESDLALLSDMCSDMLVENFKYISEAIALNKSYANQKPHETKTVSGVELDSLVSEIKDILPHLGEGFIEACLEYYDYETDRVIAAVLENNLPPEILKLEQDLPSCVVREYELPTYEDMIPDTVSKKEMIRMENQETFDFLNDKTEINEMREKFSSLALICEGDEYDDEYDDTYDDVDVAPIGDDEPEFLGKPFVTPRILATARESDEEDYVEEEEVEETDKVVIDQFVPNPAELRAKQEERRMSKMSREHGHRNKGQSQDGKVNGHRNYKDGYRGSISIHNRKKLASRKRNMPLPHS